MGRLTGPGDDSRDIRARELLRQLWLRNRSVTLERMAVVESALAAVSTGVIDPQQRSQAVSEAHKLRGILGTYGFAEGSVLAEEAEKALNGDIGPEAAGALSARLGAYARSLEADESTA